MKRTLISRYIQSLRARKGYSADFVAAKAQISLIEYLRYEESPELAPASYHNKVLDVLCISLDEKANFQIIAQMIISKVPQELDDPKKFKEIKEVFNIDDNVVSLWGKRELPAKQDDKGEKTEC